MPGAKRPSYLAHGDHSVPDALLFLYEHQCDGYSVFILDLDSFKPSHDHARRQRLPDPILSFGEDGGFPCGMRSFVCGSRLFIIGGCSSSETYYVDLDAGDELLVKRGQDMPAVTIAPLIIPVGGMFYVFSPDLSYSSLVMRFDPGTDSWALLKDDLGLPECPGEEDYGRYCIISHVVDTTSIYLSTSSEVFVFHTDSGTWTKPDNYKGGAEFTSLFPCIESSRYYVACSASPHNLLLYPKLQALKFTDPIVDDFDLIEPFKEHVTFYPRVFLLQASQIRFCYVCEGYDLPPDGYGNVRLPRKHFVVHTFDLLQGVAPIEVDSSRSSPDYQHICLSRDLYFMDDFHNSNLDDGEIANALLINRKDLGHKAFKWP